MRFRPGDGLLGLQIPDACSHLLELIHQLVKLALDGLALGQLDVLFPPAAVKFSKAKAFFWMADISI